MIVCKEVQDYIDLVRNGPYPSCREQLALCDLVERVWQNEDLYFDRDQFDKYMSLQKYFSFKLFEWEVFLFALNNCLYKRDGQLRFPDLFMMSGRGTGKNGYISFSSFALSTPVHGVENYNIDIFATSEDQAETSPKEIRENLKKNNLQKKFYWNQEVIRNLKTGSEIRYRTSNPKTKDGGKPGMIIFDEYHAYENDKLISVAETGLGKVDNPRKWIITTNGDVRGGPLDDMLELAEDILFKEAHDLGLLVFICRLDNKEEVDDERNWHKANPSLRYRPTLLDIIRREYRKQKVSPSKTNAFMTKRMNLPPVVKGSDVTAWENIKAANREIPDLSGADCVAGIDYAKTSNFVACGFLFLKDGIYYWITHTWVCKQSPQLKRIKAPLDDWEQAGLLSYVDAAEIPPDVPVEWLEDNASKYFLTKLGMDNFRVTLFRKALKEHDFDVDNKNKTMLCKRVTMMRYAPVIQSLFNNHRIIWGINPLMNWYVNNTYVETDKDGNMTFCKKDPNSRMTDGFMALVAAICASEGLEDDSDSGDYVATESYSY